MENDNKKTQIEKLLDLADIKINGSRAWDVKINNPNLYGRILLGGPMALGESYMDGWWECEKPDEFFYHLFTSDAPSKFEFSLPMLFEFIKAALFNLQSLGRAFQVAQKHYDLGNDFFAAMIGESMNYTCGYWKDATDLTSAQMAKMDLVCRKLRLQPGQKILDIGCGWGAFAKYATQKYGVSVVGITVSKEQLAFAKEYCQGLPVEFRLQDYRLVNEKFDHIVSIGMFEAVGAKNFKTYMEVARRCLKEDGLFLLHTIGNIKTENHLNPWLNKYIFPNGLIPSLKQISASIEKLFVVEDLHNFGSYYDNTLMAWYKNFKEHWPQFEKQYGQRFYKMWEYYLNSCAAFFRSRKIELWQIVLSPNGVKGGYQSVR